ncbi:MAG: MFS transporter, partial [Rhizobiales bacterium]|nr:MFS transporter [Hyphomicrobiales bacterium]
NSPVAFLTVMLVGVINGAFGTLAPVFGTRIRLSTPLIALMMGITVVSGALTQVPAGRLSDKTDRRYVIAGTAIGAALAGILLFSFDPTEPARVLLLTGFYGASYCAPHLSPATPPPLHPGLRREPRLLPTADAHAHRDKAKASRSEP